jgi:DNA-binding NtrC family response regulator
MKEQKESKGTVLVVDDDEAVLVLIQNILTAAEYRVLLAADREGALRMARQKHIRIDLALLDVRIPGVRGSELSDEIQSIRPNTRILWMSGFVDAEFVRVKMIGTFAGFLSKPTHHTDLLAAVRMALEGFPLVERAMTAGSQPFSTF